MSFTIQPPPPGASLLKKAAYCREHDCPMLPVVQDGQPTSMCLYDIIEQTIGGQRVKYVKTASGTLRSIRFENGYILEPLCPHCGKASIEDEGFLETKLLLYWSWEMENINDEDYPSVVLDFGGADGVITDTVSVHINSIVGLRKIQK